MNGYSSKTAFTKLTSSFTALFFVLLASYAQAFHLFSMGGVNPNIAPAAFLVLSFFEGHSLILMAAFFIVYFFLFSSFWWSEFLWLALALAATILIKIFLSWHDFSHILLSIIIFSLFTFVLLPRPLAFESAGSLATELLLNCLLGWLLFIIFSALRQRER